MKITAGQYKGRIIIVPKFDSLRPITDRVRQSIFNVLGHELRGKIVLDLYAGTGALGLEALSRWADQVVFVDKNKQATATIKKNVDQPLFKNQSHVVLGDLSAYILSNRRLGQVFDLIFIDPPYAELDLTIVARAADLLQLRGLVILSSSSRAQIPKKIGSLTTVKTKIYGDTKITYLRKTKWYADVVELVYTSFAVAPSARVVELVYTHALGACARKSLEVRVLSLAPSADTHQRWVITDFDLKERERWAYAKAKAGRLARI